MQSGEPVSLYVQRLVQQAVLLRASDIHFEPYEDSYRVRCRIDGVLRAMEAPHPGLRERLSLRLKVIAGMDIGEKRLPQDGRCDIALADGRLQNLRVSSLPTVFGEKIVLRLLAPTLTLPLTMLGLESEQRMALERMIAMPHGLLLATGPTGSGKSATLFACLAALNDGRLNLSTVEDPVEILLSGVNQVAVNERSGLGFAQCLRALLRQDPDVIMVGEVRDALTAEIAVKAALTGHRIWASLHANSARAALARLASLGVQQLNLTGSSALIVAQRLVRCLCHVCRRATRYSVAQLAGYGWQGALPDWAQCYGAGACDACGGSGYRGRIGVFELLQLTESRVCQAGADDSCAMPVQAGLSLRQAALLKALRGEISLEEAVMATPEGAA